MGLMEDYGYLWIDGDKPTSILEDVDYSCEYFRFEVENDIIANPVAANSLQFYPEERVVRVLVDKGEQYFFTKSQLVNTKAIWELICELNINFKGRDNMIRVCEKCGTVFKTEENVKCCRRCRKGEK